VRLTLIGWSRGTTTTAGYAAVHPEEIEPLVLLSPVKHRLRALREARNFRYEH
jgi:pimeloyl-ACP methyl ester carboxylesterase